MLSWASPIFMMVLMDGPSFGPKDGFGNHDEIADRGLRLAEIDCRISRSHAAPQKPRRFPPKMRSLRPFAAILLALSLGACAAQS
jgi:hypothetical protein